MYKREGDLNVKFEPGIGRSMMISKSAVKLETISKASVATGASRRDIQRTMQFN